MRATAGQVVILQVVDGTVGVAQDESIRFFYSAAIFFISIQKMVMSISEKEESKFQ